MSNGGGGGGWGVVQLPYMLSLERSIDSASRERVGKSVTLQGNLDPCALYASEVPTRAPARVCEFVPVYCMVVGMVVLLCVSMPASPLYPIHTM